MNQIARDALLTGWLGSIEHSLSEQILSVGRQQNCVSGQAIARLGEEQHCLHGVVRGSAKMYVTMNEQPPKFAHVAGPGFWFGDHEILNRGPRIMEIEATDNTMLFCLDRSEIDKLAKDGLDIWQALYVLAVMNQGTAIGAADDLMIRNSRQRLAAVLLRLSSNRSAYQGVQPVASLPVTWHEVAEAANLSRSKTASLLAEFSTKNFIQTERKMITIRDPKGMQRLLVD